MQRIIPIGVIAVILAGILYACSLGGGGTEEAQPAALSGELSGLVLSVQAQGGTFNAPGQTVNYQYNVTNSGSSVLPGPVTVTDNKVVPVNCAALNTVGNLNDNFDPGESIACTGAYVITQADLASGSIASSATASVGGVNSNTVSTTVPITLAAVLELTSFPNPTTYNQAGQVITFTYTIKNKGTAALGPTQFVVRDDRLGTINCGGADTTIGPEATITCTGTYTTTENDRSATQVTFNTVASGGGATNTQPLSTKITNTAAGGGGSSLTPGSTIKHQVNEGEWMIQIARCYGADFKAVRNANPQVIDANKIWPINVLNIPNIGSNGKIYGPPCVTYYTVQSGDTWESIAGKYNADLAVLLEANKSLSLTNGTKLKIPLNSAGGNPIPPVSNEPIRLNFPSGSNVVTVSGTVSASKGRERYVLNASQGQTLKVKINAPGTNLQLAVTSNSGIVLKAQDTTLEWSGAIPASGDYYIDIINSTGADKLYQMEVSLLSSQTAFERVSDINPGATDSSPSYPAIFNGSLYFRATGGDNAGAELWKYDGTAHAVSRVADIQAGPNGSNPAYLASYSNELYFGANGNDGAGIELWRFNGTDTGRLTDINVGAGDANPSYMTEYKGLLYFSANGNDGAGIELWQTNGTTYSRVIDINGGAGDSNPSYLTVYNDALYFSAVSNDGAGTELWKYDGTNLSRVTDINTGVGNANPMFLTVFNNALYFSATSSDGTGTELWKYDGTNTARAADINSGAGDSFPSHLAVFNNKLYFSANGNDGAGFELWSFDGTNATRVGDLNTSGDSFPSFLITYNNQLYFQANGGDGTGKELWRYKGP